MTTTQDIPTPAGAIRVYDWGRAKWPAIRTVHGTSSARVAASTSTANASAWRCTSTASNGMTATFHSDNPVTPTQAREFAAVLLRQPTRLIGGPRSRRYDPGVRPVILFGWRADRSFNVR